MTPYQVAISAETCRSCAGVGRRTHKVVPAHGALAICPLCDRLSCQACERPIVNPAATRCTYCGTAQSILDT
jgi:hypothetical protein